MKLTARIMLILAMLSLSAIGVMAQDEEAEDDMMNEPAGTFVFVGDSVEISEDTLILSDVSSSVPFIYDDMGSSVFDQFDTSPLIAAFGFAEGELMADGILRFNTVEEVDGEDALVRYTLEVSVAPIGFDAESGEAEFSIEIISASRTYSEGEGEETTAVTEEIDKFDDLFDVFEAGTLYMSGDSAFFEAFDEAYLLARAEAGRDGVSTPSCTRGC